MNTHDADNSRQGDVSSALDGDRGKIDGKKNLPRRLLVLFLVVALLLLYYFYTTMLGTQKNTPTVQSKAEEIVPSLPGVQAEKARPSVVMKMPPPDEPIEVKPPIELVPTLTGRDYSKMEPAVPKESVDPWAAAREPNFTQSEKIERSGGMLPLSGGVSELPGEGNMMPKEKLSGEQFADRLRPALNEGVKAKKIANPSLTITKGTQSSCVLQTAVRTDVPGMITCKVAEDVRSTDGKTTLIRKDSLYVGEYHNGLEMGEETIFVLWTRYEDKQTHVTMDLNSPGTDELGRAGMSGKVNTKFWQRFGAAIMVSIIGDLPSLVGRSGGGTTVNAFSNTTGAAADSVKSVLDIYKNVRSTMNKNHGGMVNILFARDLDFSSVYQLRKVVQE
jgi:type IV secretion system protein VirB10